MNLTKTGGIMGDFYDYEYLMDSEFEEDDDELDEETEE